MVSERLAPGLWTWTLSANDATQDHSSSDPATTRPRVYLYSGFCCYT